MDEEIELWEEKNRDNILAWEVHYGFTNKNKDWIWFENTKEITFRLKDGSTKKFITDTSQKHG